MLGMLQVSVLRGHRARVNAGSLCAKVLGSIPKSFEKFEGYCCADPLSSPIGTAEGDPLTDMTHVCCLRGRQARVSSG